MSVFGNGSEMERLAVHQDLEMESRHGNEDTSSVLIAKGVTMLILCSVSTCMGILPMQMARCLKWNASDVANPRSIKLVSLLLGFGGGVLFCTTFAHLLPEVREGVEHLVEDKRLPALSFSLAEILACTGFFVMYLVEESVHTHLRKKQASREESATKDVNRSTNELVENGQPAATCVTGHSHFNGHGHSHHIPVIMDEKDDFVISSLRGLLIVLGLSVHELFEGLAIGLESSSTYVWYMFVAVAAHKFVIAFCIGVELIACKTRRYLSVIYVCTFAVVSPIGIGIGMFLTGGGSAATSGLMAVILQGLATGTLLYVVFFEILQEHRSGLNQYVAILFGFIVMFGLQLLTAHSHSHSHEGHGHSHEHTAEHQHEDEHHNHQHHRHEIDHGAAGNTNEQMLTGAINRVTESIAEAVSNALSSSTLPSTVALRSNATQSISS